MRFFDARLENLTQLTYIAASGYFNVYGNAARKDKHDWVVHLGDYIYEYGATGERTTVPEENCHTLYDYRARHGQVSLMIGTPAPFIDSLITEPFSIGLIRICNFWPRTMRGSLLGMITVGIFNDSAKTCKANEREIEVADNAYRDGFVDFGDLADIFLKGGPEISTDRRKANAVRAYFEWMPIRSVSEIGSHCRVGR